MGHIVAWVGFLSGAGIFFLSTMVVRRANLGRRLPYWRAPVANPRSAIRLRCIGCPLIILSTTMMSREIGYWTLAIALLAFAPTLLVFPIHNRRLSIATPPSGTVREP